MSGFEDDFGEMVEPVAIVPTLVGEVNNTSSSGKGGGVDIGDGGDDALTELLVLKWMTSGRSRVGKSTGT